MAYHHLSNWTKPVGHRIRIQLHSTDWALLGSYIIAFLQFYNDHLPPSKWLWSHLCRLIYSYLPLLSVSKNLPATYSRQSLQLPTGHRNIQVSRQGKRHLTFFLCIHQMRNNVDLQIINHRWCVITLPALIYWRITRILTLNKNNWNCTNLKLLISCK